MNNFTTLKELARAEKKLVEARFLAQMLHLLPNAAIRELELPADLADFMAEVTLDDESDIKGVAYFGFMLSQRMADSSKQAAGRVAKLLTVMASAIESRSPLTTKMLRSADIATYEEGWLSKLGAQLGIGASKGKLTPDGAYEELKKISQYLDEAPSDVPSQEGSGGRSSASPVNLDY